MPDGGDLISARLVAGIGEVPAAAWDACAGDDQPFLSHAFLRALEDSGSASAETGWLPQHLIAEDNAGHIVGCVPMYLKSHSLGEYVFDHGWAQAFARAGGEYYPKLQVAVPFTPVMGPRLLTAPGVDTASVRVALAGALAELVRRFGVSSLHVTFCTAEEAEILRRAGWLIRRGVQYHWHNAGYASFDDFLSALTHERRKAIRRERRGVAEQGVVVETLEGPAITPRHWNEFFHHYTAISDRKWGYPYLTRDCFARLHAAMSRQIVLVLARKDGICIGGAFNLRSRDALYGRNWGGRPEFRFVHFEACYYQAIEYAIRHRLARVEAGAQGEHKVRRGYAPVATWSAHWIAHRGLRRAVAEFLAHETPAIIEEAEELGAHLPFRDAPAPFAGRLPGR